MNRSGGSNSESNHTRGGAPEAARPRLTDHAFERLLEAHADGELSPKARRVLEAELANSPDRRAAFERSERLLIALSRPSEPFEIAAYPDLSESILSRLEAQGVLLPGPKRRGRTFIRWGIAAAVALGIGGLVMLERQTPGSTPMASTDPAPVTSVVSSVVAAGKTGVDSGVQQVRQAVDTLSSEILPKPRALGLKLGGSTTKYDAGSTWTTAAAPINTALLPVRQESALAAILSEPDDAGVWLGMELRTDRPNFPGPVIHKSPAPR